MHVPLAKRIDSTRTQEISALTRYSRVYNATSQCLWQHLLVGQVQKLVQLTESASSMMIFKRAFVIVAHRKAGMGLDEEIIIQACMSVPRAQVVY